MRYRAKPVEIDAFRFDGTGQGHCDVEDWAEALIAEGKAKRPADRPSGSVFTGDCFGLYIGTLEGVMHAAPGDYVICGTAGEFYPCKPDIFNAKYEPASSSGNGNPAGARSASEYTTPESAAEQARGAHRVMDQFRDAFGGGDRG